MASVTRKQKKRNFQYLNMNSWKKRKRLERIGLDRRIILKWTTNKQLVIVWTKTSDSGQDRVAVSCEQCYTVLQNNWPENLDHTGEHLILKDSSATS